MQAESDQTEKNAHKKNDGAARAISYAKSACIDADVPAEIKREQGKLHHLRA